MEDNEKFLQKHANGTLDEAVELINDAIDWTRVLTKGESGKNVSKFAVAIYVLHVFMSASYGLLTNVLLGNLPVCFMELRLMLESLVKCHYADLRYPSEEFFQTKLKLLDEELNREKMSLSKLMKDFDQTAVTLWGKLSGGWVHSSGLIDRIVDAVMNRQMTPGYAMVVPIPYDEAEIEDLNELRDCISTFRAIARKVFDEWKARQQT